MTYPITRSTDSISVYYPSTESTNIQDIKIIKVMHRICAKKYIRMLKLVCYVEISYAMKMKLSVKSFPVKTRMYLKEKGYSHTDKVEFSLRYTDIAARIEKAVPKAEKISLSTCDRYSNSTSLQGIKYTLISSQ
jgi:hypothetical protein